MKISIDASTLYQGNESNPPTKSKCKIIYTMYEIKILQFKTLGNYLSISTILKSNKTKHESLSY